MKKLMIALLGVSLLTGTTLFAQDASSTKPKKEKKHKKAKKDKPAADAPKAQ